MAPFISSASYIDIRPDYSSLLALAGDSAALLAEVNPVRGAPWLRLALRAAQRLSVGFHHRRQHSLAGVHA